MSTYYNGKDGWFTAGWTGAILCIFETQRSNGVSPFPSNYPTVVRTDIHRHVVRWFTDWKLWFPWLSYFTRRQSSLGRWKIPKVAAERGLPLQLWPLWGFRAQISGGCSGMEILSQVTHVIPTTIIHYLFLHIHQCMYLYTEQTTHLFANRLRVEWYGQSVFPKTGKPEHPVVYHHVPIKTAKTWWLIHNFADPPAPKKNRVCNQHEAKSPQLCPHVLGSPLLKIMVEEKTIATVAISDIHWIAISPLYLNDCHIILPYSVG